MGLYAFPIDSYNPDMVKYRRDGGIHLMRGCAWWFPGTAVHCGRDQRDSDSAGLSLGQSGDDWPRFLGSTLRPFV